MGAAPKNSEAVVSLTVTKDFREAWVFLGVLEVAGLFPVADFFADWVGVDLVFLAITISSSESA